MLERNHPVAETPCAVCDSESLILQEEAFCEEAADMEFDFIPKKSSHLWGIGYWDSVYDMQTDTAVGVDNLVDICPENLQDLKPGDQLLINRDPEDPRRLQVCRLNGSMVGRLHWANCAAIVPMLEDGTIKQVELRVHSIQPGCLQVEFIAAFQGLIQCTVYRFHGDTMESSPQEMGKLPCTMSVDAVKALFELHNRYTGASERMHAFAEQINLPVNQDYKAKMHTVLNTLERSYCPGQDYSGGDHTHFGSFVLDKIQQEPQRYGVLAQYEIDGYARLEEILEQHCLPEETRYWLDGDRVTEDEYQDKWSGCPRFRTLALIDGKQADEIPDSQIGQTIFSERLVAFAELN